MTKQTMTMEQARRIMAVQDDSPWCAVADAKKVLGIVEPDYLAEMKARFAAKDAARALAK